jgi:hypothetical protein
MPSSWTGKASRHSRGLSWQEGRGARNPDHERVEGLVEARPAELDRAEERLGMGDGRRSREHGRRGSCPAERAEHAAAHRFRSGHERVPERRACDALGSLGVVRIAAQDAREHRVVEDE